MTNQSQSLKIHLASVEDGLENTGFRKFAASVKSIHSFIEVKTKDYNFD
jgi:hypothetical protein